MDRFIVKSDWKALIDEFNLKSNMDRFIVSSFNWFNRFNCI